MNVLKLHTALHVGQLDRVSGVGHFLGFGQELEHTLGRRGGLLEHVGNVGKLRDRLREGTHILNKRLDVAHGDGVAEGQPTAQDADRHVSQVADKAHDRHHHAR